MRFSFSLFLPLLLPLFLSGGIRNGLLWEAGKKGGQISGQNQLNSLQMVQFECPKVANPCVSFTFDVSFIFSAQYVLRTCVIGPTRRHSPFRCVFLLANPASLQPNRQVQRKYNHSNYSVAECHERTRSSFFIRRIWYTGLRFQLLFRLPCQAALTKPDLN